MRSRDDRGIELTKKPQAPVPFTSKEISEMINEENEYLKTAREDLKTTGRLAGGIGGIALLIGFIALGLFFAQLGGALAIATTPLLIMGIVAAAIVAICAVAGGITASRLRTAISQSEDLLDRYEEALSQRETQVPPKTSPSQTEVPSKFTQAAPQARTRSLSETGEGVDRGDPLNLEESEDEGHPPTR